MNKKAQITIFIIIALVIVAVVILIFSLKEDVLKSTFEKKSQEATIINPQIQGIHNFIISCIKETSYDAIDTIGRQGGYFIPTRDSLESGIPYYIFEGEDFIPSKNQIEKEISTYINEGLFFCVKNFGNFPNFEINQEDPDVETKIKDEKVILNVNYPLSIRIDNSTAIIENFRVEIPIRLGIIYDVSSEIVQENIGKNSICLSCLINQGIENDLSVNIFNHDENTTIFIILDKNSQINNKSYEFKFAIKS